MQDPEQKDQKPEELETLLRKEGNDSTNRDVPNVDVESMYNNFNNQYGRGDMNVF